MLLSTNVSSRMHMTVGGQTSRGDTQVWRPTMKRLLTNAEKGLLSRSVFTWSPPLPFRMSKACLKLLTIDWNACMSKIKAPH